MKSNKLKSLYWIGTVILLLLTGIIIWHYGTNLTLGYTDTAFHLATAQGFVKANGIVTWDFWESLPIGRPHDYPPLFHLVLASLIKMGIGPATAIKIMIELTVVGGLTMFAWSLKKLFNIRVSFWSTFFLALSFNFLRQSATVMPATIVVFLAPALFYCLINKKWLSYVIILIFMFYLHMFMPYIILLSLFIYVLLVERQLLLKMVLFSAIAFVFYAPWLIHILNSGIDYIKYFDSNYSLDRWKGYANVNLVLLVLLIPGLIYGFKRLKNLEKKNFLYFFAFFLSVLILSFFATDRTIDGHLLVPASVIAALFLAGFEVFNWKVFIPGVLAASYVFITPYFLAQKESPKFFSNKSTFFQLNFQTSQINITPREVVLRPIINKLNASPSKNDSIISLLYNFDNKTVDKDYQVHVSNYFCGYTGLSTIDLYDPEVHHRPQPDIISANYIIVNLPPPQINNIYLSYFGYKDLDLPQKIRQTYQEVVHVQIDEDNSLYLLKNREEKTASKTIPSFVFPLWLAGSLLITMIAMIVVDIKRKQ